ncbi:MAG: hypothetical protein CMJ32_06900 [Phycisphaerae bacterium]|nr:hypothetical protein [Phycisphaerae bacterium]
MGLLHLATRRIRHEWLQAVVLVLCIAVSIFLPATSTMLMSQYNEGLMDRAARTPVVIGSRGSRFDLVLSSLYFRPVNIDPVSMAVLERSEQEINGVLVPLHLEHTAQGFPVVGTTTDYMFQRELVPVQGTVPVSLGEALVGADVASSLGLAPGNTLRTDMVNLHDLSVPLSVELKVCGVLPETDTPDDQAVLVDLQTTWLISGLLHGHVEPQDATEDEEGVSLKTDSVVVFNPALDQYNSIDMENIGSFHHHVDPDKLPLSAILLYPRDAKEETLARTRINEPTLQQAVIPRRVIDDLLAQVFKVKRILDGLSIVVATCTGILVVLVITLSIRSRRQEHRTLHMIGCAPGAVTGLVSIELLIVLLLSILLAAGASLVAVALAPDLLRLIY